MQTPYIHFCLDIETANSEPTEAERWMRQAWAPAANWKPATIGERYLEMLAKKKERLALLDTSPIIAVGIKTDRDLRCLHSMRQAEPILEAGLVEGFGTEREMLSALRNLLDGGCVADTLIIGHNIRKFDLPKLRQAYVRNRLRLPVALVAREQPTFDTMDEYGYGFSLDRDLFVSVDDVGERFGLARHNSDDGADVPGYFARGEFDKVIARAMGDATYEYDLFLRMAGLAGDGAPPAAAAAVTDDADFIRLSKVVDDVGSPTAAACAMSILLKGQEQITEEQYASLVDRLRGKLEGLEASATQPAEPAPINGQAVAQPRTRSRVEQAKW